MQDHPVWNLNEPGDSDHSAGDDTSGLTRDERRCAEWSDENNEQNCIVRETDKWHDCDVEQNTQNIKSDGYWCAEPPPPDQRGPGGDVLSNTPILLPVAAGGRQSAT